MPEPTEVEPAPDSATPDSTTAPDGGTSPPNHIQPDTWERVGWIVIAFAFVVGFEVRRNLWPADGLRGDLDQFVGWVHHIAVHGLGSLYSGTDAGPVTFGPVMAYIWAILAAVQPGFATATDASDELIRSLMKVPASLADFGLALIAVYALRRHLKWAALAAVAILFHPAVLDVSAWWGQYESIFVLSALAALVLAINGHNGPAAALVAVSLMTKPQAVPFLIPFAAWFWVTGTRRAGADGHAGGASGGIRELIRTGLIGLVTSVVLWLPFILDGGPANYLSNLATYQNEIFNVISLRAWNVWWLVQELLAGGSFVADDVPFLGPVTLRHLGYLVTGALSLVIAWAIIRDPRPRTLILGLTASVLVFFTFMTQMHERYAYAALIFLVLLLPDLRIRWLWVGFGVAFTLNLLAAVPPTPEIEQLLPVSGVLGIAGSVALIVITVITLAMLRRSSVRSEGVAPTGA
jgi:Gpi18-like mannosyltransferase